MGLVWSSKQDKFDNNLQENGGKNCLHSSDDSCDDSEENFYETMERQSQSSCCDNLVQELEIDSENFAKESLTATCTSSNVRHVENTSKPALQGKSSNAGEFSRKVSETNSKCIANEEESVCIDNSIDRWKTEVDISRVDPLLVKREEQIPEYSTFSLPFLPEEKLLKGKYAIKSLPDSAMQHEDKIPQPAHQGLSSNICGLNTGEIFITSQETNTKCIANEEDSDCSVSSVDRWMTEGNNNRSDPSLVQGEEQMIECSTFSLPFISEEKLFQGKYVSKSLSEPVMSVAVDNLHQQQSKAPLPCAWQVDIDCFKSKKRKKLPKKYLRNRVEDSQANYGDKNGRSMASDNQGLHQRGCLASTDITTQEIMAGRKVLDLRRWYNMYLLTDREGQRGNNYLTLGLFFFATKLYINAPGPESFFLDQLTSTHPALHTSAFTMLLYWIE